MSGCSNLISIFCISVICFRPNIIPLPEDPKGEIMGGIKIADLRFPDQTSKATGIWYLAIVPDVDYSNVPPSGKVNFYAFKTRSPLRARVAYTEKGRGHDPVGRKVGLRSIVFGDEVEADVVPIISVDGGIDRTDQAVSLAGWLLGYLQEHLGLRVNVPALRDERGEIVESAHPDWREYNGFLDRMLVEQFAKFLMSPKHLVIISVPDIATMLEMAAFAAREAFERGFSYAHHHGGAVQIATWASGVKGVKTLKVGG